MKVKPDIRAITRLVPPSGNLVQGQSELPIDPQLAAEAGAITRRAKVLATVMMAIAAALLFWLAPRLWIALVAASIMAVVCTWLWLRPEPPTEP